MKDFESAEGFADIVDAVSPDSKDLVIKVGVEHSTFRKLAEKQQATKIAQYYGNVQAGLIGAQHAFRGLNRPFELDGDMHADGRVIIYSWRPRFDWTWSGGKNDEDARPVQRIPPPNLVFVVLVLLASDDKQEVTGSIVQWNWVAEDALLPEAPEQWNLRYQRRLWSK